MDVTVSKKDDLMIVSVTGRLDLKGSGELEDWTDETLCPPKSDITMDFSQLDYISSAGLRSILNLSKLIKKHSHKFSICGAPDHIREVLEISGFDSFIPLFTSVEEYLS